MKYIKTYEKYKVGDIILKKYVVWRAHPEAEALHVLQIIGVDDNDVLNKCLYSMTDHFYKSDFEVISTPSELFTYEYVLYQTNSINDAIDKLKYMKITDKFNL